MSRAESFLSFDDFRVGETLGVVTMDVDRAVFERWQRLGHSQQGEDVPPGLLVALLMRGYTKAVANRPPGNVHAGLGLDLEEPARLGDTLEMSFTCAGAELRKGRRWVDLGATVATEDRRIAVARLAMIWAR